jgi:non-ribosomal peptide synthetase component E (peptide arylation enzyme)
MDKLYRVTLRGMTYNSTGIAYGVSYVIAKDPNEAYQKVRKFLDDNDIGFTRYRELDKVELIADTYRYTDVGYLLHL